MNGDPYSPWTLSASSKLDSFLHCIVSLGACKSRLEPLSPRHVTSFCKCPLTTNYSCLSPNVLCIAAVK